LVVKPRQSIVSFTELPKLSPLNLAGTAPIVRHETAVAVPRFCLVTIMLPQTTSDDPLSDIDNGVTPR
jgi:hypothetical protein